jgi:hypothetical protein
MLQSWWAWTWRNNCLRHSNWHIFCDKLSVASRVCTNQDVLITYTQSFQCQAESWSRIQYKVVFFRFIELCNQYGSLIRPCGNVSAKRVLIIQDTVQKELNERRWRKYQNLQHSLDTSWRLFRVSGGIANVHLIKRKQSGKTTDVLASERNLKICKQLLKRQVLRRLLWITVRDMKIYVINGGGGGFW